MAYLAILVIFIGKFNNLFLLIYFIFKPQNIQQAFSALSDIWVHTNMNVFICTYIQTFACIFIAGF